MKVICSAYHLSPTFADEVDARVSRYKDDCLSWSKTLDSSEAATCARSGMP